MTQHDTFIGGAWRHASGSPELDGADLNPGGQFPWHAHLARNRFSQFVGVGSQTGGNLANEGNALGRGLRRPAGERCLRAFDSGATSSLELKRWRANGCSVKLSITRQ
jgi:hypothetical protein